MNTTAQTIAILKDTLSKIENLELEEDQQTKEHQQLANQLKEIQAEIIKIRESIIG